MCLEVVLGDLDIGVEGPRKRSVFEDLSVEFARKHLHTQFVPFDFKLFQIRGSPENRGEWTY